MRNEETEGIEIEYQQLILPDDSSGSRSERSFEGETGEEAAKKAKKSLPKEPDLDLLAKQIREEMEREAVLHASARAESAQSAPENMTVNAVGTEEPPEELPESLPTEAEAEAETETPKEPPEAQPTEEPPEELPESLPTEAEAETETPKEPPEGSLTYEPTEILTEIPSEASEETPEVVPTEAETETPKETPEEARIRRIRGVFEYIETFCVALGVMILLFLFVFRYVSVDGDSMEHTLHGDQLTPHADRLIISDFLYEPKTGDIVVINTGTSEQPLIKRVIAVGGQTVRINFEAWEVTVDGVLLEEDYIWRRDGQAMVSRDMASMYGMDEDGVCEFTVGEGKVFVMGDNRNNSKDSRFREIGEQDANHILGKVILRLYPLSEFGTV